jgi:hypothetical protein
MVVSPLHWWFCQNSVRGAREASRFVAFPVPTRPLPIGTLLHLARYVVVGRSSAIALGSRADTAQGLTEGLRSPPAKRRITAFLVTNVTARRDLKQYLTHEKSPAGMSVRGSGADLEVGFYPPPSQYCHKQQLRNVMTITFWGQSVIAVRSFPQSNLHGDRRNHLSTTADKNS